MALPAQIAAGLYFNGLPGARSTEGPTGGPMTSITGVKVARSDAFYTADYAPGPGVRRPSYQIAAGDPVASRRNLLFVNNIANGVAVGLLPRRSVDTHVLSDNFGGCEFHILAKDDGSSAAFLHLYKGLDGTASYAIKPGSGWTLRAALDSGPTAAEFGTGGTIVAYSFVSAGSSTAECCFLVLDNQGRVTHIRQYTAVDIA